MERTTLKLFLMGQRVLSAELMRSISDVAYLEKEIEGDNRLLRRRVARRLRSYRRRALQKAKLEKLVAAGFVFATDVAAWQQWRGTLQAALEHSVNEIGLALPRHSLLEMQIQKAMVLAERTTAPLTIHVNSRTSASLHRVLETSAFPAQDIAHSVIITDYLDDDSCIIETPNGLYEANVGREVEAFCEGVKSYLRGHLQTAQGQGEAP